MGSPFHNSCNGFGHFLPYWYRQFFRSRLNRVVALKYAGNAKGTFIHHLSEVTIDLACF